MQAASITKWAPAGQLVILDIAMVKADLSTNLLALDPDTDTVELDLAGVFEFDGAGVQLLLALQQELAGREIALRLSNLSGDIRDKFQRLQLEHQLCWQAH